MPDILLDYIMDIIALSVAMRLSGHKVNPIKTMIGAFIGTLATIGIDLLQLTHTQSIILWIPVAGMMMFIAGGSRRKLVRNALILLCAEGLLGGIIVSLIGATGSLWTAYAIGTVFALISATCVLRSRRTQLDVSCVRVLCTFHGNRAEFEAMVDSGNCLRDYLTHLPVVVLSETTGRTKFHINDTALRPILAQTAGGQQMMWCFIPEEMMIIVHGKRLSANAVVALSPGLQKDALALLPASLIT